MPKKKERSEVEYLKAQNRELSKENKRLKRSINRVSKKEHVLEDLEDRLQDEAFNEDKTRDYEPVSTDLCPNCGKDLDSVDLIKRVLKTCVNCEYRLVIKK
jgi:predicted RNase H-like nuclease (RuvC/YqgF family)